MDFWVSLRTYVALKTHGECIFSVPEPTPILRFIHVDNIPVYLTRGGLHASNCIPDDGMAYKTIHNVDIQSHRPVKQINCGPCGVIHDYIPFYFGPLSPMMLQLKTGQVEGYSEGQDPLVYLVSTAQEVCDSGMGFVFSDGHGIAAFTSWFDDLTDLDKIDWDMAKERYWSDNVNDMDRQCRKQAEFLVLKYCDWSLIHEIVVIDSGMKSTVEQVFDQFPTHMRRRVRIDREWYYY
jgi:hypothetical protein